MTQQSQPTKPDFSIREATLDDLNDLVRIESAVHVAPWSLKAFEGELEKPYSHTWVMTDDETDTQVAGYVVFWLMLDECQILNVAVDLPYRGLSFAKQLVRKVADQALRKNLKKVILSVRTGNAPAIQLYQTLGFMIHHVRKGFYSNGEDAYEMMLDLTSGHVIDF